ncbi:sulfurtransferase complex subunit TusB [Shewanella sp. SR43-4]|uniref:sulfurtransferase complex subunit TusB n=1 Tax=Shewanella TaxID=22 RepID=UPI000C459045|nr:MULTISPECIES: sulfurtransferase complex subunit TusB [Shewanella]NCQ43761.1 sulfurtransferase complex subunit TusB [Shewanella frigidimarina]MBB1316972.1 sulfurtransferase complex subunit TusB [Shewanella sp. SR43-4]MBB1391620.1 sulfurtransferase complex subunit TusB [Shewanella sp. SG44-6]NCO70135.1 sulfurtransferase complex subunit TusB [Shewanella vesiculosa]NCP35675.1 sulfurtransferase complex subunit TusB [Shewanella vesiculosa]
MILHHIQASVMSDDALSTCLRYIHPKDSILLSSDAVNCLLQPQWQQRLANIALFVLQDDVVARGLSERLMIILANKAAGDFDIIDYSQFVEQSLRHDKVITW